MDLYRLESEAEAIQAGVEDLLYSGALCIVEWPQKAPQLLPPHTLFIQITQGPGAARVLQEIPQLPTHEKM
jgi:tRNA threonylcarbamoyladenosine biosynthesis protein TsaE